MEWIDAIALAWMCWFLFALWYIEFDGGKDVVIWIEWLLLGEKEKGEKVGTKFFRSVVTESVAFEAGDASSVRWVRCGG
ncbi:hypothetical protein IE53DRAFT_261405 [Violaceomyces palustris]|uniref:Uncharacterized protein n=1 Tax=Violaceomyces palustris TaxID=1673888 RepID=A0ACD0NN79_9BASI|nr:hypothetical protein IE53DRAFT_261405 [Violaceomyces palustris]